MSGLRPDVVSLVLVLADGDPAPAWLADTGLPPERVQLVAVAEGALPPGLVADVRLEHVAGPASSRRAAGAAAADGEYLVLADAALAVPPGAPGALVEALERDPSCGAVGVSPREGDLLSVRLELAGLRTSVWREAGGLAPELDGVLDDVDLGWRLSLLGRRVRGRPLDVVLPPRGGAPDELAAARLAVAYRNLAEPQLRTVLAAANAATAEQLPHGREVVQRVTEDLPRLAPGRRAVQAARQVRHDRELLPLVWESDLELPVDRAVLEGLGALPLLTGRQRVLVVTGDTLGERMAGPAIRAWEIAHGLADEHDVVLLAMGGSTVTSPRLTCLSADGEVLREYEAWCDVLVFQGYLLRDHPWLAGTEKVLVADVYDPMHLEVLEQEKGRTARERADVHRQATDALNTQLLRADFLLCASPKQRDLWLGHLASLGRISPTVYDHDPELESLIAVVPFGVPAAPPVSRAPVLKGVVPGIGPDDAVLLWGGGIYNWFDPLTLLHAVDVVRRSRPDVRLYFLGTQHPNPMVPKMRMAASTRQLAEELGLAGTHVFFNEGWVRYEDRGSYLLEADLGVSCHYSHVETAFSFRTRILDYLWAGLPIVTTEGDHFGDLVTARELGAAVPAEDVEALAAALLRLLDDDQHAKACRARVAEVAEDYRWERALAPLRAFCARPRHAVDRRGGGGAPTEVPAPRRSFSSDVALARSYLQDGGVVEVVRRAGGRLRRR